MYVLESPVDSLKVDMVRDMTFSNVWLLDAAAKRFTLITLDGNVLSIVWHDVLFSLIQPVSKGFANDSTELMHVECIHYGVSHVPLLESSHASM